MGYSFAQEQSRLTELSFGYQDDCFKGGISFGREYFNLAGLDDRTYIVFKMGLKHLGNIDF